jgi:hypothetical protein
MKVNQHILLTLTLTLLLNSPDTLWGQTSASQPVTSSGKEFMVPKKEVNGKLIGQEDVLIQEVVITDSGRQYRRLDVGVSGTVAGWVVKEGNAFHRRHFRSAPEFTFTQIGIVNRLFHGIVRYEASMGMGLTLIYPEAGTGWNKKLFVTVHGGSGSFLEGTMKPWNRIFDPSQPLGDISKFERLMLDKGYAIAKTRRNASVRTGDYSVTLDDGEILEGKNINTHTGLILGFAQLAENLLKDRFGEKPLHTYWYGHSGGGMNGRLVNYVRGVNVDENEGPIIDGFLIDDSGEGLYLPVLEENGRDTLFVTEKERRRFVKTIEIIHQLYSDLMDRGASPDISLPQWVSPVSLVKKRVNAKMLIDKGLGDKIRMYEVRGVSHHAGGLNSARNLASRGISLGNDSDVVLLDLSGLMDGLIDLLDNWVERDVAPPASKSGWLELGDVDGDGVIENEAIALPEVACPLGLYYQHPLGVARGVGWTGFAPFDGQSLEPLDGRGVFVDMNLNRYLDHRESVDQAWHRLSLLKPGETFSRSQYQACVEAAVDKLKQEKLITERVAARYIQEASEVDFPGQ